MFLVAASEALGLGVILICALRRWLGDLRWPIAVIFPLSIYCGSLAAKNAEVEPLSGSDIFSTLALAIPLFGLIPSLRACWTARTAMGPLLHAFARPARQGLTWIGWAIMLMAALILVLGGWPAIRMGWGAVVFRFCGPLVIGSMGYYIAEHLGCVEFRAKGILSSGVLYPWTKLAKFEWILARPPLLRIQVRPGDIQVRLNDTLDIRNACPEDAEVEAILVEHGLTRS